MAETHLRHRLLTASSAQIAWCLVSTSMALAAPFRTCHFGNSQTDVIRNVLPALAQQAGHTNHVVVTRTAPGVPLSHFVNSQNRPSSQALLTQRWDAVVLQIYSEQSSEGAAAVDLSGMAYTGNTNCQIYLYVIWPYANHDWNNPPLMFTERFAEGICTQITAAYPGKPAPLVVPASLAMRELGALADRGELPNVASHFQLLTDGTHPSKYGSYAANCLTLAQLHRECPTNYPVFVYGLNWDNTLNTNVIQYTLAQETAVIIKEVVWDVLRSYHKSGVNTGLAILGRTLPAAVVDRLYTTTLTAVYAHGAVTWSLAPGESLPPGLTLAPSGVLSGVVAVAGTYVFVVQASDASRTDTRRFSLTVSANIPPIITTTNLAPQALDEYRFQLLTASGGVGRLTWSLISGRLPLNMTLAQNGAVYGTPGEAGLYTFTVRVQDEHPDGARAATNTYQWHITNAASETLIVKKTRSAYAIDGQFNESFWDRWEPISKPVQGTPTKTAMFAAVWWEENRTRGRLLLGVKVRDGARGVTASDAIDMFIDALHNRELVYNSDDMQKSVPRSGTPALPWSWSYQRREVPGGFDLEMAIEDLAFYGQPATVHSDYGGLAAGTVYGFDLIVTEAVTNKLAWRGTANNPVTTVDFGSLWLTDRAAGAPPYQAAGPAVLLNDGDFPYSLYCTPYVQMDMAKLGTWYSSPSYAQRAGPDGNPGNYLKLTGPWTFAFVCLPAPAGTDTWTISFDRRSVQQWNAPRLDLYACKHLDIPGSNEIFNMITPFKTWTLTNSATWLRHSYTADIPAGYDMIALRWFVNTADTNAGIDNVRVTETQRPPVFTNTPLAAPNGMAGVPYSETLAGSASDPNRGEILTFEKRSGPSWLLVATNGTMSGTPATQDIGTNTFVIRVTDAAAQWDEAPLTIVVLVPEPGVIVALLCAGMVCSCARAAMPPAR